MKLGRQWVFYTILIIWLANLAVLIYSLVYAPSGSFAKQYAFVTVIFFISFSQLVKRAHRYSFTTERRFRNLL